MKKFIIKLLIFKIPVIFLIVMVITMDFFKIHGFQNYYSTQKIELNREVITTSTFNHFMKKEKFNSFIFGSSRSQAYKCANWSKYLDENAVTFHFDASGEGIWGVSKKIEYINEIGDTIKNALIVIDRRTLRQTNPRNGHLFIPMPCISQSSKSEYYLTFLKASLNPKFLIANLDYSIFKTYRGYMGSMIRRYKYDHQVNNKNCDTWYGYDKHIAIDSLGYYNELIKKGIFYKRPKTVLSECKVTLKENQQLKTIKNIFEKHKTKYKIVISPVYDQIPMEKAQIELLENLFGKENIYNFSGKNQYTQPIHNYYESSHYRPNVANDILDIIYQ